MAGDEGDGRTAQGRPRWNAATTVAPRRARRTSKRARGSTDLISGRFDRGAELGRGGMGAVVAARDAVLGRPVAIKQALADDEYALRVFEREARIIAQLEHASIIPVHDLARDADGRPYYVMRQVDGQPLADVIARARSVEARLALVPNVLAAVDAIAFAHARGVIHRDIKPLNLLVSAYGETLVIDWGLARHVDDPDADALFGSGTVGTPGYMAPEQARGESVGPRADVYALGATLLHVLLGDAPLDGNPTTWLDRVATSPESALVAFGKVDPQIPRELVAIALKAMAPRPEDRYADAGGMAEDLRAFLAGKLVAAHRYTTAQRLARFVRRHRFAVATAVLAVISILVVGALSIQRVVRARDRAEHARAQADDRAELMLVDRASVLATTDPTRAVALLRTLPTSSRHLLRARDVASRAAAHGIAHGFTPHTDRVSSLALSPDGRHLASTSLDGTVQLHELATRRSRVLARDLDAPFAATFVDGGRGLAFAANDGAIQVIDLATGTSRVIATVPTLESLWSTVGDDRVWVHDRQQQTLLIASTIAGRAPVEVARGVTTVSAPGRHVAYIAGGALMLAGDGEPRTVFAGPELEGVRELAVTDDGTRIAMATRDSVLELDATKGAITTRQPATVLGIGYMGSRLVASNLIRDGELDLVLAVAQQRVAGGNWATRRATAAHAGWIAVATGGELVYVDRTGGTHTARLVQPSMTAFAARAGVPTVATASHDGTIRWWELSALVPRVAEVPRGASLCARGEGHTWLIVDAQPVVLEDDGTRTHVPAVVGACPQPRLVGDAMVTLLGDAWAIVERSGVRVLSTKVLATSNDEAIYVDGRDVVTIGEPRRVLYTADAEIRALVLTPRYAGVALADRRFIRIDRATGVTERMWLPPNPDQLTIGADGIVWASQGSELYALDPTPRRVTTFARTVSWLSTTETGNVLVGTAPSDLWRLAPDADARPVHLSDRGWRDGGPRTVVLTDTDNRATRLYVDTGERIALRDRVIMAVDDGRTMALLVGAVRPRLELYDDPVPTDPAQLHAWIESATNAAIAPDRDALTWR